jgi:hypothetical protein
VNQALHASRMPHVSWRFVHTQPRTCQKQIIFLNMLSELHSHPATSLPSQAVLNENLKIMSNQQRPLQERALTDLRTSLNFSHGA